jgi:hypothetical protein
MEVLVCKSLEKTKQVQLYRPSRIKLELCVFLIMKQERKTKQVQLRGPGKIKLDFWTVWVCKSFEKTKQIQLYRPSRINLDLRRFFHTNHSRNRNKSNFTDAAK